jgi:hypothetical protein
MIHLTKPEKPLEALRAIAASGSSGYARKAQAELQARMAQQLARELGR